jgi:membrane dipeptidase
LLEAGVAEGDVAKVVGRNLLRVWREVDRVAEELQGQMGPVEEDLGFDWD